jgi:hypothetical protein
MKNKYEIRGDVTAIFVRYKNENIEALIDTSDLQIVSEMKSTWSYTISSTHKYIQGIYYVNKQMYRVRMHRLVLGLNSDKKVFVDHINHNTLDNRKSNLRIVTNSQNLQNLRVRSNNKSGVRGVCYIKSRKKWIAEVRVDNKITRIGYYDSIGEAENAVIEARARMMPFSQEAEENKDTIDRTPKLSKKYLPKKGMKSGVKNVYWDNKNELWFVKFVVEGKPRQLGTFKKLEDAMLLAENFRRSNDPDYKSQLAALQAQQ